MYKNGKKLLWKQTMKIILFIGYLLVIIKNKGDYYPFIIWADVKYADVAWSCSDSWANEWPRASHAGENERFKQVAFLLIKN